MEGGEAEWSRAAEAQDAALSAQQEREAITAAESAKHDGTLTDEERREREAGAARARAAQRGRKAAAARRCTRACTSSARSA